MDKREQGRIRKTQKSEKEEHSLTFYEDTVFFSFILKELY